MPPKIPVSVIFLAFLGTTSIVIADTAGKWLTGDGVSPYFVAWSRFLVAVGIVVPFCGLTRTEILSLLHGRVILRGALIATGVMCILTALKTEPVANVFGGFFIGPIASYVLSALLLGEKITFFRSVLLVFGFFGVLLVVQPGPDMGVGMIWALLAGTAYGFFLVMTRWLAPSYRPRFLLAAHLIIAAVVTLPFGVSHIPALGGGMFWGLILISALGSALGNFLLVVINKTTPASVVAPLVYLQLIAAAALGYLVFGDWPDPLALSGLLLILASGLAGFALVRRGS